MPNSYDLVFVGMMLAYVFMHIGPAISGVIWKIASVPAPPAIPVSRDLVRPRLTQPHYPFWAHRRGQVGWVLVDVEISPSGGYLSHEVVAEAPAGLFTQVVAKALRTTTYGSHSGFPLPPRIRILYKFVVPARDGSVPPWAVTTPGMIVSRNRWLLD
jgi:hypothetical protein